MTNLYELTGPDGIQITYRDGSFERLKGPELFYVDSQSNLTFTADSMTIQNTLVGTLVSVVTHIETGVYDGTQFTLILPAVTPPAQVSTIGINTTSAPIRFPDPSGQDVFNAVVNLEGSVTTLIAHG